MRTVKGRAPASPSSAAQAENPSLVRRLDSMHGFALCAAMTDSAKVEKNSLKLPGVGFPIW